MKTNESRSARILRLGALPLLGLVAAGADAGCLTRPIDPIDTRTTWTAHFKQIKSGVNKIDLLLMLDNSGSMADKQAILADAVPSLVKGLLDPACVGNDGQPVPGQPQSPADDCPAGSAREFQPVLDVHIGIVTSSLGGHGADICKSDTENDHGHLISRKDPTMPGSTVDTYKSLGFLAWDPKQALVPPGEIDLDTTVGKLREMVQGAGQIGCGFESQLESWYRFLVDPEPYTGISLDSKGYAVQTGLDQALLDERAAFLRPDSMVAVLMLTDENDCSTRETGQAPLTNDPNTPMPRARQECEKDINDPCCAPCTETVKDCPVDAKCMENAYLAPSEDPYNLRCWDQKRRFGRDFLYPVDRYTQALTAAQIAKRNGDMVDNPLYPADPDGKLNARNPSTGLVFIAGIVGVPWQDIARQRADGTPDLLGGLDGDGKQVGGFMSADELSARDPKTHQSRWDVILGDPSKGVAPLDPLMRESRKVRMGQNPITGAVLADPSATSPDKNAINGHEWNTDTAKLGGVPEGDLQYACVFELKDPRDCATATTTCDCSTADTDGAQNPLCQDTSGAYTKVQRRAKGYPGVRELEVLKGAGEQGIVASVCPAQVINPTGRDYGYAPAIGAIIDRLKHKLTGQCLPRPLTPRKDDGKVACVVIEASKSTDSPTGKCCDGVARHPVSSDHTEALGEAQNDAASKGDDCFCEIDQLGGAALKTCQTDTDIVPVSASSKPVDGWCYVDQTTGAPSLVDGCAAGEKYKVRFVGAGQPGGEAVTFITCAGGGN